MWKKLRSLAIVTAKESCAYSQFFINYLMIFSLALSRYIISLFLAFCVAFCRIIGVSGKLFELFAVLQFCAVFIFVELCSVYAIYKIYDRFYINFSWTLMCVVLGRLAALDAFNFFLTFCSVFFKFNCSLLAKSVGQSILLLIF